MKVRKMIDAEELKERLTRKGDKEAIKIVEEMQGYKKFYAVIHTRLYGEDKGKPLEELGDWQIDELVSVSAKDESDARKRIKSVIDERHERGKRTSYNWNMQTIRFVSEEYAKTAKLRKRKFRVCGEWKEVSECMYINEL